MSIRFRFPSHPRSKCPTRTFRHHSNERSESRHRKFHRPRALSANAQFVLSSSPSDHSPAPLGLPSAVEISSSRHDHPLLSLGECVLDFRTPPLEASKIPIPPHLPSSPSPQQQ